MAKTETGHSRAWQRRDAELAGAAQTVGALGLQFLAPREFALQRPQLAGHMLGVIAFGNDEPSIRSLDCPATWIDMPVPGGDSMLEVWTSDAPVVRDDADGIAGARNADVLFGCLTVAEDGNLEAATHHAYCRIFDYVDSRGYGHLLRLWNYFPAINDDSDGLERYRKFSIGRHDAFIARRRIIDQKDVPAACALGSRRGPLVIYFIAARNAGQPVENPRQISAYHYPAQYGPRSPTFSRAMLMRAGDKSARSESALFISGTASIVGHETLYIGDAVAQARETFTNIRAVMARASAEQPDATGPTDVYLKVYLRDPGYLPIVQTHLSKTFADVAEVIYLQADICRADLLLEIEAVCLYRRGLTA